jgi:hypothetical protein
VTIEPAGHVIVRTVSVVVVRLAVVAEPVKLLLVSWTAPAPLGFELA